MWGLGQTGGSSHSWCLSWCVSGSFRRALNMQALVAHKQGGACDHLHMQAFACVCSCSHVILSQQQVFVTHRAGLVDAVSVQRGKCMG